MIKIETDYFGMLKELEGKKISKVEKNEEGCNKCQGVILILDSGEKLRIKCNCLRNGKVELTVKKG